MTRLRPVLVILAILGMLLAGMAIQRARMRAGQMPQARGVGHSVR